MDNKFDPFKFDPLKQASDAIADLSKNVDASTKDLTALIAENAALKQSIPLVVSILEHVTKSGELIVEGMESTNALMDSFQQQYEEFDHVKFQASLIKFTNDSFDIGRQVARILDKEIALPSEFLIEIMEKLPKFMLFGVSVVVDSIPNWDSMPGSVLDVLKQIPSLNEARSNLCRMLVEQEEIYKAVFGIQITVQLTKHLLQIIAEILPRDLTATIAAQVVAVGGGGAGGGTTLFGHPIRIPFTVLIFVFNLVDNITNRYIELYQTCATDSWQSSVFDQMAGAMLGKENIKKLNEVSDRLESKVDKVSELYDNLDAKMSEINKVSDHLKSEMEKLK